MKKVIYFVAVVCIVVGISPAYGEKADRLNFVGGPPSGVFGIFATGIGTYLSKNIPNLDVSITATGGSVENIRRVNNGEAEMGLSFASDVHEAYFGLEQFKGKPLTNFRAIGVVFFGVAHVITYADSGIRTAEDLAGKRVAVGTPGSGSFTNSERVFRTLGVWDKINRIPLLGAQAGEAMQDGKADAFSWTGPEPDRVTMEAATKKPIRAIDIYTPAAKTDFFKHYPYFARYTFPAGSYKGITEDTATLGIPVIWYVHKDVAESLVQKMIEAAYSKDGSAHMLKVHAGSRDMMPEKALQGVTFPLHKGAENHWKAAKIQISDSIRAK